MFASASVWQLLESQHCHYKKEGRELIKVSVLDIYGKTISMDNTICYTKTSIQISSLIGLKESYEDSLCMKSFSTSLMKEIDQLQSD